MVEPQAPATNPQQPQQLVPPLAPQRPGGPAVAEVPAAPEQEKHTIPPEIPYAAYHMAELDEKRGMGIMAKLARGGWKRIAQDTVQSDDKRFTITHVDKTRRNDYFLLKDLESGESYEETTMTGAKKKAKELRGEAEDIDGDDLHEEESFDNHQYCEKCGECTSCNLRDCTDGGEHQVAATKQGGMYDGESMSDRSNRMGQMFLSELYKDSEGVIRWRSNHQPVPPDIAADAENSPHGSVMEETPNLRGRRERGWAETQNTHHSEESNTETPNRTANSAVEDTMATPIQEKTQKAATSKWARLRQVAADEPKEADAAIGEVADALGTMADALTNLKENLDLVEAPKNASIKLRVATARKYATAFRRIAEEAPEVVAGAISEVYHSLDDVAGALENLAEHMGIELSLTPAEEAFGEEGQSELAGEWGPEEPESGAKPKVDEEKFEEAEKELESPEAAPAEEKLDEEIEKEAGSIEFVTDRDETGDPKAPIIAGAKTDLKGGRTWESKPHKFKADKDGECDVCGYTKSVCEKRNKKEKKADGSAAFVNDRDENAKPEAPEKLDIPQAQGETEVGKAAAKRAALRERIAKRWGVTV